MSETSVRRKGNCWILALKLYHTLNGDVIEPCFAKELLDVGEIVDIKVEISKQNWIIPVRGTKEYNDVILIYQLLKHDTLLEEMGRELMKLHKDNNTMASHLAEMKGDFF